MEAFFVPRFVAGPPLISVNLRQSPLKCVRIAPTSEIPSLISVKIRHFRFGRVHHLTPNKSSPVPNMSTLAMFIRQAKSPQNAHLGSPD